MPASSLELLVLSAVALLLGGTLVWLLLRRQAASEYARGRLEREPELAALRSTGEAQRAELETLQQRLARLDGELRDWRERADRLSDERATALGRLEQMAPLRAELQRVQQALEATRAENARLATRLADTVARGEEQQRASEEKLALLAQAEQRLRESFSGLAQQILDERAQRFGELSQKEIGGLVEPLKEQLREFRETLASTHAAEQRERGMLSAEINTLKQLNQKISEDAVNLTRALRGDTQAQGAWGELVLERLLQASGLQPGREYETQTSLQHDDGGRARPDVIVRLPDDKDLVIDAKVSLVAYERFVAAQAPADAELALREHLASLKRHIDQLGGRQYSDLPGLRTLDFVLMFVPVEAAFVEAVRRDETLYLYALERNVALVSPSTLLATLRTVAHLWKIERRNQNATEIAVRAGRLYDYMVAFVGELDAIGQQLGKAQDLQAKAIRRLTEGGKGSVILQVQALAELGAKSGKRLPAELLQRASDDAESGPGGG
jgi:DNA recombination protein RmuC